MRNYPARRWSVTVEEVAKVADYADRLSKYMGSLVPAVNFFVWGMAVAGYWLILTFICPGGVYWILAGLAMLALALFMAFCLFHAMPLPRRCVALSHENLRWALSFAVPFLLIYSVPKPTYFYATSDWYLALGVALLAVHIAIERHYVKSGRQVGRPFLLCGTIVLATSPAVAYATIMAGFSAWTLSLGLMLLAYCSTGLYCISKAWKLLF